MEKALLIRPLITEAIIVLDDNDNNGNYDKERDDSNFINSMIFISDNDDGDL